MHYVDEGVGPPIVMVHGNPTWSFYYRRLIDAFSRSHRCVAMDHIGCGLSDRPGVDAYDFTLQARIDDLDALLDHLHIDAGATLVVHDWGGMIGMGAALRRPERFARFVILNTAAFLLPASLDAASRANRDPSPLDDKPLPWQLEIARRDSWLPRLLVRGLNLFCWGAAIGGSAHGLPRDVRRGLMAPYGTWRDRLAVHEFVKDIPLRPTDRSYEAALAVDRGLSIFRGRPMLICWGMQDFVFDGAFLAEWRQRFPQATVHAFEDAGHYVLEDAPNRIIRAIRALHP